MATAREHLLQELLALTSKPFDLSREKDLQALLLGFRVQVKPGDVEQKDKTAREHLAERILREWQESQPISKEVLLEIVSCYRMQVKVAVSSAEKTQRAISQKEKNSLADAAAGRVQRAALKQQHLKQENAYFRNKKRPSPEDAQKEPVAGGPKRRSGSRGQCPKCHSMGVVLARSYGGDEYFSCIYCGFQAYRSTIDPELDIPLANELLGRTFDEHDRDD